MRGRPVDGRRATPEMDLGERLLLHSQRAESGCLLWTGSTNDAMGYGRIGAGAGKNKYVHVVAWELENGPVPDGMVVRHSCDTPPCMELAHLVLGTQRDNVADMFARGRESARSGEANNSAKLDWGSVRLLRIDREQGAPVAHLVQKYGICKSQVRNIITGHHWKEAA